MRHAIAIGAAALLIASCAREQRAQAGFVSQHDWAGRGEWLRTETHVHTRMSDGAHPAEEVVAEAVKNGCDVVAITDHGDRRLEGATPKYGVAIELARVANPKTIVISGLEWNVPPFGGREHATVLMPDGPAEVATLAEFKRRFDDYDRPDKPNVEEALGWLQTVTANQKTSPVVIYNHPSRKDETSLENANDILAWRKVNELVIGFEGAPGHQGREPIGSYEGGEKTIDRWDPVVATPGGAWDRLLQQGLTVHGAIASSDFHDHNPAGLNDYWPCQFAETLVYAPERTVVGVLRALRAGTTVGVHGRIARDIEFSVANDALPRPAIAGEVIQVPIGTVVDASVKLTVPETDWEGKPNRVDAIEFIVITPAGATVKSQNAGGPGTHTVTEKITVGEGGVILRARGRRTIADGPDLMFYTNAIRIAAR
jgi:hypothetical protein